MAVTLTGYGGVEEIGGNAFLLDDGRSRIFLDFGRRFGNDPRVDMAKGLDTTHMRPGWGDYFDEFLQPRGYRMAHDLIATQVIPDTLSVYRTDIGGTPGPANVDGVLVSHAHADHCGLLGLLKPDVPVLMSEESRATMASLQETGQSGVQNEYLHYRAKGYGWKQDGGFTTRPKRGTVERPFMDATKTDLGTWDIQQFQVDHSIHGARATILQNDAVSLCYTGDFRMHGREADATKRFIERAGGVDVLVAEGTNVSQGHKHEGNDNELEVEAEIEHIMEKADGFVCIAFPPRDLDRLISIHHVAKRTGRRLVVGTKQAHLLQTMRAAGRDDLPDPFHDPHIVVHLRHRGRGSIATEQGMLTVYDDAGRPERVDVGAAEWSKVVASEYAAWERPYLEEDGTITSAEIGRSPEEFLFSISYWTITDLLDIFPDAPDKKPGGLYIHSMTQPFNDEMEISDRKLRRWLDLFGLERHDTHVSGHLSEDDLHWVIDEIGAKRLVPVHSMHPSITAEKYEARTGQKALMPSYGRALPLA